MIEIAKQISDMTIQELISALRDNGQRVRSNVEFILELAEELQRRTSMGYAATVERERDEAINAMEEAWKREASGSARVAVMQRIHDRRVAELNAEIERLKEHQGAIMNRVPRSEG